MCRTDRPGSAAYDVVLLFVTRRRDLLARLDGLRARLTPAGALWVVWPKRASAVPSDLDENVLRDVDLPTGMVDNKVGAVDQTDHNLSGLRFVVRLRHR